MEETTSRISSVYYVPTILHPTSGVMGEAMKRLFDILTAAVGLTLLSPLFIFVALKIRRDSPGPIFYRGARVGLNGRLFHILKFRTMYDRPESFAGPRVTAGDDDRVTRIGKKLRATKLNELPQLWNVLIGEMSLVGPRPEDPDIVSQWPAPIRQEILSVRPGITSPASIMYRDEENLLSSRAVMDTYLGEITPSKLRLDQLYVRYHSLTGDLDVLLWTALVLLPQTWAQAPREEGLFLGPLNILMRRHVRWFLIDTMITFIAIGTAGVFWRTLGPLDVGVLPSTLLALGFALLFSVANALRGVNQIEWSQSAATDVIDLVPSAALATGIALFFNYLYTLPVVGWIYSEQTPLLLSRPLLPLGLVLISAALAFTGFVLARYRSRLLMGLAARWEIWSGTSQAARERVLIVGGGESGRFAAWTLTQGHYAGAFRVVGLVDDDFYKKDLRIYGMPVLGRREHIPDLAAKYDVGIIVFAIHRISAVERRRLLEICHSTAAQVVMFPDIGAAMSGLVRPGAANGNGKSGSTPHPETQPAAAAQSKPATEIKLVDGAPSGLEAWITDMEAAAARGDLVEVRKKLAEVRKYSRL